MRNDYTRERNRWDRISGEREVAMRAPTDDWMVWGDGYVASGPVTQVVRKDLIEIPADLVGLTGKALRKAMRDRRREEKLREGLDETIDEMVRDEHYGSHNWGGF
jgi:hypothetical protein